MEQELVQAIELVSAQLGIAVEKVFGIFVGAQPIIGMLNIVSGIVIVLLAYFTYKVACKTLKSGLTDEDGDWKDDDAEAFAIIFPVVIGVLSVVLWWLLVGNMSNAALKIMCPEYTAMKEIIELATR